MVANLTWTSGELGDITGSVIGDQFLAAGAGALIGYGIDKLTGGKGGLGAAIGGIVGFGITLIPPFEIGDLGIGDAVKWFKQTMSDAIDNAIIQRTLNDLDKKLKDASKKINKWSDKEKDDFKEHFGTDDDDARDKIKSIILNEREQVKKYKHDRKHNKIQRTNDKDADTYAYVYSNDKVEHKIHLERQFWKAHRKGKDSKFGTLAHEISHFNDIGGTGDYGYGVQKAQGLTNNPGIAIKNADNFEYYIEKTPLNK